MNGCDCLTRADARLAHYSGCAVAHVAVSVDSSNARCLAEVVTYLCDAWWRHEAADTAK